LKFVGTRWLTADSPKFDLSRNPNAVEKENSLNTSQKPRQNEVLGHRDEVSASLVDAKFT